MYSINQLRDYSSLFTRSEISRLMDNDFSSVNLKIDRYALGKKFKGDSYLKFFKKVYKILEKFYPNEYIFKNQFLNTWLKEELGSKDSIIFNELRLGKSIADLAMFNGISKAFEIKTILDKDYRLSGQLNTYKKVFNEVYIIIPAALIGKYEAYDEEVGIILYEGMEFILARKAKRNELADHELLMGMLHTKEYRQIVTRYYSELPEMNAFSQFEICKSLISMIPYKELNVLFLEVIKQRKLNRSFFSVANIEFNQICLSLNLCEKQKKLLIEKLSSRIT